MVSMTVGTSQRSWVTYDIENPTTEELEILERDD